MKKIQLLTILFFIVLTTNVFALNYSFKQMWPVLEQPWFFYRPSEIVSDDKGFLYIADTGNNRIRKFTTNAQFITQWGELGDKATEFNSPYGIAMDSNGYVYVADTFNHRIQKFSSDGEFVLQWGHEGNQESEFDSPHGITISPENYVYVADSNNDRIQMFTDTGLFLAQWNEDLNFPTGMASGNNGTVYIADTGNDRLQKIVNNRTLSTLNLNTIELIQPKNIAVDTSSNIYITDYGNQRLIKINSNGDFLNEWNENTSNGATFESLYGITIDPAGYIYTSDNQNNLIQKLSDNGTFMARWDINGMFNLPSGIAVEESGKVYVADTQNHRIQKFSADGQFETAWGGNGFLTGLFNSPSDVAVGEISKNQRIVFVSDTGNSRIQLFSTDGDFLDQWGQTELKNPSGIDLDSKGYLYVANQRGNNIYVYDSTGTVIREWGGRGSGNGQFKAPYDVACDNTNPNPDHVLIYVADTVNNRIQKFSASGDYITQWGTEGKDPGKFYYPTSLTIDQEGLIYVTDMETQRIQVFQPDGTFVMQWGEAGYYPGQFYDPIGLDVGPDNNLYIADTFHHRIQVFHKTNELKKNSTSWSSKKNQLKDNEEFLDKAIIVAGGGPYPGNDLWDATQLNTNYAYQVLIYNGFEKNRIAYLSHDMDLDLDANGKRDDVDDLPENDTLENMITQWASDARHLFVFMVDHGGDSCFRMTDKEILTADMLDNWLDDLQSLYAVKTTVIVDSCQSGSFIPELTPPISHNRIMVTSANANESAYFLSNGYLSFAYRFWTQIFTGNTVGQAFYQATSYLDTRQHPQLDDNNDGQYNESDGILAQDLNIGVSPINFGNAPIILSISDHQTITQGATATINVYSITDKDTLSRVWATFHPPSFNTATPDLPIHSFPEIDLMPVEKGRYSGSYSGFIDSGTYTVIIYATDIHGNISLPAQTTVSIQNNHQPQAIIIAGHSHFVDMQMAITNNVQLAHDALIFQGFSENMIHILGPQWLTDSDNIASIDTFQLYMNHIQLEQTVELIIYMVGQGDTEIFDINASEILHAKILDQWLDEFQSHQAVPITFIYDASNSGSFIPFLIAEGQQKRIVITGAGANQAAQFIAQGMISFSQFFWRGIYNGFSLKDAFFNGQNGVDFSCNIQVPQLDDNGNGISNESLDGIVIQHRTIGAGIRLAENSPFIGTTNEYVDITQSNATITAKDVAATDRIQQMIAVVSPPCAAYTGFLQVITETVVDSSGQAYTFHTDQLDYTGDYQVTWFAVDKNGMVSKPSARHFSSASLLKDAYEPDNSWQDANVLIINDQNPYHLEIPGYEWQQQHNFHDNADEDWFSFMAVKDEYYKISVEYDDFQPEISLFASNQLIEITNTTINVQNNVLTAEFAASYSDVYYVRIQSNSNLEPTQFQFSEYRINLTIPAGTFGGFIYGSISPAIKDAIIRTTANNCIKALPNGKFFMPHAAGSFVLRVETEYYDIFEKSILVHEIEPLKIVIPLVSRLASPNAQFSPGSTQIGAPPLSIYFSDQSDGQITEWMWDFGDGSISNAKNITHSYDSPGIYSVVLTVKGPGGSARTSKSKLIIVTSQDTDNDLMPDDWESQYGLDPYVNDASSDLDNDGLSNLEEYHLNSRPDNSRPEKPTLNITDLWVLYADPYVDPDISDQHVKTHWQVSPQANFSFNTLDIIHEAYLQTYTITALLLDTNTDYYARVQFLDNYNGSSQWSDSVVFSSPAFYVDNNMNQIPDDQEINDHLLDLDENQVMDIDQDNIQLLKTVTGVSLAIAWDNEKVSMLSAQSADASEITNTTNRASTTPCGLFRFKYKLEDNSSDNIDLSLYFKEAISPWARLFSYDDVNFWQDISEFTELSDKSIRMTIQDGGVGDADLTKNGEIVNISEIGIVRAYDKPKDGDSDVGMCFIYLLTY